MCTVLNRYNADLRTLRQLGTHKVSSTTLRYIFTCSAYKQESELVEENKNRTQRVLELRRDSKPSKRKASHDLSTEVWPSGHGEAVPGTGTDTSLSHGVQGSQNNFDASASPRVLSDSHLLSFERLGHISTRSLLDGAEVSALHDTVQREAGTRQLAALSHRIRVLLPADKHTPVHSKEQALRRLTKHSKELGFLQHFNLHREVQLVRSLVTSRRMAALAAQLLGEKQVRVYQDCVFVKEPGFTPTNWHSDLPLSPLDTNSFVTAWIPLRPLKSKGDSGLEFAEGSHRDIAVHARPDSRSRDLSDRGYRIKSVGKMELGDVSWHHGWLLHYAPPQPLNSPPRMALAVSYFGDGARVRRAEWSRDACMQEDKESYADWLGPGPGQLQPGAFARHTLLPIIDVR